MFRFLSFLVRYRIIEELADFHDIKTNEKEDLRAIKDLPFIKATSLGVITDKY